MSRAAPTSPVHGRGRGPDAGRIRVALAHLDAGELAAAAAQLGPMVSRKRPVRGGRSTPESEEIDEVKTWLRTVEADPSATDARFMVERAYYKLRTQLP